MGGCRARLCTLVTGSIGVVGDHLVEANTDCRRCSHPMCDGCANAVTAWKSQVLASNPTAGRQAYGTAVPSIICTHRISAWVFCASGRARSCSRPLGKGLQDTHGPLTVAVQPGDTNSSSVQQGSVNVCKHGSPWCSTGHERGHGTHATLLQSQTRDDLDRSKCSCMVPPLMLHQNWVC